MKRFFLIPAVLICLAALIFMAGCPQSIGGGGSPAGTVSGTEIVVVYPSTDTSLKTFKLFTGETVDVDPIVAAGEGWNGGSVKASAAVFFIKPNHPHAKIRIEGAVQDPDNKTKFKKDLEVGENTIYIEVTPEAGPSYKKTYRVKLTREAAADGCNLQNLQITESTVPAFSFNAGTYFYGPLEVFSETVRITAASEPGAIVYIQGTQVNSPIDVNIVNNPFVQIEVKKDGNSNIYILEFKSLKQTTVTLSITDSIGGTSVSGTTLKVYKSGTTEQIGSDYTITNGKAVITGLVQGRAYDFELIGQEGQWAGSRLENYTLADEVQQTITMIQPEHLMITRGVKPPRLVSVKADIANGSAYFFDITEETVITGGRKVRLVVESENAAVVPTDSGGFGAKLGIGKAPSRFDGIEGTYSLVSQNTVFCSEYEFLFTNVPDGQNRLVAVGYDTAGNRIERHIPVKFESSFYAADLSFCKFTELWASAERLPYSEGILSLQPVGGRRSSYKMMVNFKLVDSSDNAVPILGFDLYRKIKDSSADFRFVSRTLYSNLKTETESGLGFHAGFDTDSQLEENKEYEYKIRVFNEKYERFSPVITVKLLESFTYELTSPAKNTYVPLAGTANLAYKCKISNTNMFSLAQSDGISLGLLINKFDGEPVFGANCFYILNGSGAPDMLIYTCNASGDLQDRPERVSTLISGGTLSAYGVTSVNDLVKVDKTSGEIEFTEKFLKVPFFNVIPIGGGKGLNRPMVYKAGTAYQWDIQDWGWDPYDLYDDEALSFIKGYPYTSMIGSTEYCDSISRGNNSMNGANAINGRITFTVTP